MTLRDWHIEDESTVDHDFEPEAPSLVTHVIEWLVIAALFIIFGLYAKQIYWTLVALFLAFHLWISVAHWWRRRR